MAGAEAPEEGAAAGGPAEAEAPSSLSLRHFLRSPQLSDCVVRLPAGPELGGGAGGEDAAANSSGAAAVAAEEIPCHRVVLAACSGYFFRRLMAEDLGPRPALELPPLPEDEELRRQLDISTLFQLVLEYAYADQRWEAIAERVTRTGAMGLLIWGELLEIRTLSQAAFGHLEDSSLDGATAAKVLYAAVQLRGSGDVFEKVSERCLEALRSDFSAVCGSPESMRALCQLPVAILSPLLEADGLNVRTEGAVLQVARQVLRSRMRREEAVLALRDVRLTQGAEFLQRLSAACGIEWEVLVVEEPKSPLSQTSPVPAEVAKYAAEKGPLRMQETGKGQWQLFPEMRLRVPLKAVGRGCGGCLLVRACAALGLGAPSNAGEGDARTVLLAGLLPVDQLPDVKSAGASATEVANSDGEELAAPMQTPDGRSAGMLHFRWHLEPVDPGPAAAAAPAAPAAAVPASGEASAPASPQDSAKAGGPLAEEEASRVLAAVRWPQLLHEELLEAVKDPVLLEAGAQQRVLEALSSRLSAYEHAEGSAQPSQGPRPSTLPQPPAAAPGPKASPAHAPREGGEAAPAAADAAAAEAAAAETSSAEAAAAEAFAAKATVAKAEAGPLPPQGEAGPLPPQTPSRGLPVGRSPPKAGGGLGGSLGAGLGGGLGGAPSPGASLGGSWAGGTGTGLFGSPGSGGPAGQPLGPCGSCGQGQLRLRQRDLQWCVQCSRYPRCQNVVGLPRCVVGAVIDGHCAACSLRLGANVRTLSVRLGREHLGALAKLPGGVDTLRGVCIAGCTDTLALLGGCDFRS